MNIIASWVYRDIKLPDTVFQVLMFSIWHDDIVEGVLIANLIQLWVVTQAKHLVEHLEGFVLVFGCCKAIVFSLFSLLSILHTWHKTTLSRYESFLSLNLFNLPLCHNSGALLEHFCTFFSFDLIHLLVWVRYSNAPIEDDKDSICMITEVAQAMVLFNLV